MVRTTGLKCPSYTCTITNFNTNRLQTLTTGQHNITYKTQLTTNLLTSFRKRVTFRTNSFP